MPKEQNPLYYVYNKKRDENIFVNYIKKYFKKQYKN